MSAEITMENDLWAFLGSCAVLSNLSSSELAKNILRTHAFDLHALLALVESHPSLNADVAQVLRNFDDQSMISTIIKIAPTAYPTLELLFAHGEAMWNIHSSGPRE
jgi:hypothetical protein